MFRQIWATLEHKPWYAGMIIVIIAVGLWGGYRDPLASVVAGDKVAKAAVEARQLKELRQYDSVEVILGQGDGWYQSYEDAGFTEKYSSEAIKKDFIRRNGGRMPRTWANDRVKVPSLENVAQR